MKVIHLKNNITQGLPCVATIGFFDGVHKGHLYLIEQLKSVAKEHGMASAVITFDKHPRQVLSPDTPTAMLSTLDEKVVALSKTGIDICIIVPFTRELAAQSAFDFMNGTLKPLSVKVLLTGYDNRFGHNRSENFENYTEYGRQIGIQVIEAKPYEYNGKNASSSLVRRMIADGDVDAANTYLGRPYTITGVVVEGYHIGRSMRFPTANIEVEDSSKLIPKPGVYAVKVRLNNAMEYKYGMMNIGSRPTFNGSRITIEVNIFNCKERLYGETVTVAICHRLRDERKFADIAALKEQLKADAEAAKAILQSNCL